MKIAIGNDHVALEMKQEIAAFLKDMGHKAVDFGTDSAQRCDYDSIISPL